jgi:AMP-polyphosphate phosphotransferase
MFETAELGRSISKKDYKARVADLRFEMLQTQFGLHGAKHPVIVLISGVDGAGKGEVVNRLNEWFDSRELEIHAYGVPSDEELERPRFWRFWRTLPPRGRIGILFGSWYTQPIVDRAAGLIDADHLDAEMHRIARFERMLVEDGAILVKLWFHLSRDAQEERFRTLEADKHQAWRVTPQDWKNFEHYGKFRKICERALRQSDKSYAPWLVIESADARYRDVTAAEAILDAIKGRLANPRIDTEAAVVHPDLDGGKTILDSVDLTKTIDKASYEKELIKLQARINKLTWKANAEGISTLCVFEGWDAGGKGGAIRRLTGAVDAKLQNVISIAAPTEEERAQHYLWRFWRHVPRAGRVTVYDRSWYGRVLVERVEGFAEESVWRRAYSEINEFEEQLTEAGIVVCKFWLHIDKDEQERRFKERAQIAHKKHKLTDEDWRNRERWDDYREAVDEMVTRCSTEFAPWTLVPANDKLYARLEVLRTVVRRLKDALG